jgi:hypothetical protein
LLLLWYNKKMKNKSNWKKIRLIAISGLAILGVAFFAAGVKAATTGWMWGGSNDGAAIPISTGVGWISANNTNPGAGGVVIYNVNIPDTDGNLSGYAWSENVGWIDFAPAGPYPAFPYYSAKRAGIYLEGWARIVSIREAATVGNSGGWQGWIKLKADPYAVSIDGSGNVTGYAWSNELGWINFGLTMPCVHDHYSCTNGICGSSDCDGAIPWTCHDNNTCGGSSVTSQGNCSVNPCSDSPVCTCAEPSKSWKEVAP